MHRAAAGGAEQRVPVERASGRTRAARRRPEALRERAVRYPEVLRGVARQGGAERLASRDRQGRRDPAQQGVRRDRVDRRAQRVEQAAGQAEQVAQSSRGT